MNASRHAAVSASITYALLLTGQGVYLPFFPLWLAWRGFNAEEIGMLLAIPMFMRVVASAPLARIGDGSLGPRRTFLIMVCGSAFAYAALPISPDFLTVALALGVATAFLAPTAPLLDVIVLDGVSMHGHDYGRIRQWGSLAWLLASLAAGSLFGHLPIAAVPPILALLSAVTVFAGLTLPDDRRGTGRHRAETRDGTAPDPLQFAVFTAGLACLQGAHAFLYSFATLIWQHAGFNSLEIGAFWAVGVVTETGLFLLGGNLAAALGPWRMIFIGAAAGLIRWICLGFEPKSGLAIAALQSMHGLSFAIIHLATIHWLSRYERGRAARQGLVASIIGAGLTAGTVAAGQLYAHFGGGGYFVMAIVCTIGGGLIVVAAQLSARPTPAPYPPSSET